MSGNALRITAILLFVGAILIGLYGLRASQPAPELSAPAPVAAIRYTHVVASTDLKAGHVLQASDLELQESETPQNLAYSATNDLIGRSLDSDISKGSILLPNHFPQRGAAAQLLKAGERGVALKVDEVIGVGGFIQPGDHVDVLLYVSTSNGVSVDSSAQSIIKDVRVISYGENLQQVNSLQQANAEISKGPLAPGAASVPGINPTVGAGGGHSAVLAVREEEVAKLMLAASGGTLRLSLRGAHTEQDRGSDLIHLSDIAQGKPATVAGPVPQATGQPRGPAKVAPVTSVIIHAGDKTESVSFKGQ